MESYCKASVDRTSGSQRLSVLAEGCFLQTGRADIYCSSEQVVNPSPLARDSSGPTEKQAHGAWSGKRL